MPVTVSVKADIAAARAQLKGLENKVNRAAGAALGRVATTTRKAASDRIRERIALKAGAIKAGLLIKSPRKELAREIVASGKPIALKEFQARQTKKGATFRVRKSAPRKLYQLKGRKGFISTSQKLGGHVYARIEDDPPGPKKGRIKNAFGPSLPQYFVTTMIRLRMKATVTQRWPLEFKRALIGMKLTGARRVVAD